MFLKKSKAGNGVIALYRLGDKIIENCGNKAKYLSILKSKGYNIPLGIVLDFEEFKKIIKEQNINFETIDKIEIPDELINEIFSMLPKDKKYAIRSSASIEDSRNLSLAGRYNTYLNVVLDKSCFKDKIKSCFLSLYSTDNLQFYRKNNIDISKIEMNIIIQEMIESNVSGILFTVNPANGIDTQVIVEFSKGFGDVVDGKTVPERIVYDWVKEEYIEQPKINILGDSAIKRIINISLSLQQEIGFPIDVEFGVYDSKLYIFQVRPITKIEHKEIYSRFTNATKEATISKFMFSLDEKICNSVIPSFINSLKIINENDIVKPIIINKYSRLYWNLSLIKNILESVPGYVERNFDEMLGTRIDYLDNGKENVNNSTRKNILFHKKNIMDIVKKQIINTQEFRNSKLKEIEELKQSIDNTNSNNIKDNVLNAINLYYDIKSVYIWQSMINLIYKINLNKILNGTLTKNEIQTLIYSIDDKQNAPMLYIWDLTRKIRNDSKKKKFFEDNLDAEIFYLYRKDRNNENIKEFLTEFVDMFGYHSFNETDIIYKTYDEEILKVIKMYRDMLELDDKFDPLRENKKQNREYNEIIQKVVANAKKSKSKNILKDIEFVRDLISKNNILKNLVLMAQNVLRKYMLILGKEYKNEFIIENEEDIFNLEYQYILNENSIDKENDIKSIINKNKIYFNSFRNYNAQVDIFPCSKQYIKIDYSKSYRGIGASFGKAESRACIVNQKEDLKNLKKSDILVTKYINQDIFKNLNLSELSGIITEYGGILCHIAINARENRVPCVVSLKDATLNIKNGDNVVINGDTGEVIIK